MGLKLQFLSWWTPEWFLNRGLDELAHSTIGRLEVILDNETEFKVPLKGSNYVLKGDLHERRRIMATAHNELVETMINIMGRDKAIKMGREAMFKEGVSLGQKFKKMLGVGNSLEDLITAARILYKVLGIDFTIENAEMNESEENETTNNEIIMRVDHCSLAEYYTPETCQVLSAADEGVVQGLNPKIKIKFTERITEGCSECLAPITRLNL